MLILLRPCLFAVLLLSFCFVLPATASAQSRIAFTREFKVGEEYFQDIFVKESGGAEVRLTRGALSQTPYDSFDPSWSPDGTRIVFATNKNGKENTELNVMDAVDANGDHEGDNLRPLLGAPGLDVHPTWSPDGTRIAFMSQRNEEEDWEIYVMNADGSRPRRLTDNAEDDMTPAWSPDGSKIAFDRVLVEETGLRNSEIFVMDAADADCDGQGDNLQRLTRKLGAQDRSPAWSPDSLKLAFETNRDDTSTAQANFEIYVMDAADRDGDGQGDNPIRLTTTTEKVYDANPSWSADGSRIAFITNRDDPDTNPAFANFEIYLMNAADGGGLENFSRSAAKENSPACRTLIDSKRPPVKGRRRAAKTEASGRRSGAG